MEPEKGTGPIRIVVVGLRFGRAVATGQLFGESGRRYVRICGVCDLDQELAGRTSAELDVNHYGSLDEALADEEVDAVGLFTPPSGRSDLVRKAVEAGKHVLTTKPFELDPGRALGVLKEARDRRIAVHMNSPAPLPAPVTEHYLNWRRVHDLGQVVSLNWETHVRYHETADGSWYDDPSRCPVAPVFRLGIYGINQILRVAGPVRSVDVSQTRILTGRPTPDNAALSLCFVNGAVGCIQASFCVDDGTPYGDCLSVRYERGSITARAVPSPAEDELVTELELRRASQSREPIVEHAQVGWEGQLGRYQWAAFHQAVRSGSGTVPGEIEPIDVARGVAVLQSMQVAATSNRREPVKEPA